MLLLRSIELLLLLLLCGRAPQRRPSACASAACAPRRRAPRGRCRRLTARDEGRACTHTHTCLSASARTQSTRACAGSPFACTRCISATGACARTSAASCRFGGPPPSARRRLVVTAELVFGQFLLRLPARIGITADEAARVVVVGARYGRRSHRRAWRRAQRFAQQSAPSPTPPSLRAPCWPAALLSPSPWRAPSSPPARHTLSRRRLQLVAIDDALPWAVRS